MSSSSSLEPIVVQALYAFKGSNNDELCFHKGDIIAITQKEDGGWWEGTLGEKTGWFPSNYVREIKDARISQHISIHHDATNLSIVYKDLLDSEKAHLAEQQGLVTNFLTPLERSTILSQDEYKQLIGNFIEVLDTHKELLKFIEEDLQKPHKDQRIGRYFISFAQKMKNVHQAYCSLHPKAVCILDKYREELSKYMESCGANTPGVLVLTTGLSKPFRRLAKYSGMLLEVERHVEDSHPDRGDIQRSVAVYKDIDATCAATRRQKELETQVLTGPVRGWEGQSLSTLGDIIYMGSVAVGSQHLDRYLVLFPSTLLILSISHRLSAFIYEGKLPVTGITVTRLEDSDQHKNAFEITGHMIEKVTAVCQSKDEANHWVEILRKYNPNRTTVHSTKASSSQIEMVPQPPPHLNQRGYSTRASILKYLPSYDYTPTYPSQYYPPAAPYAALTKYYHQLVKQKVINKKLLKLLLYPEFNDMTFIKDVKRRQHRSECFFMTKDSNYDSSSDSDSSDSDDDSECGNKKISRQDAFDKDSSDSSSSSNPFGYIRYFNPQSGSQVETDCESFIDHWKSRIKMVQPRDSNKPSIVMTSSIRLELSQCPDVNIVEEDEVELDKSVPEKDNLLPGPSRLHKAQKTSEDSDVSSLLIPNFACENLARLNGSFEIGSSELSNTYAPTTRQSCPNKLVADKFNESSLTKLYIPPCQSSSDNNLAWKLKDVMSTTSNSSTSTTTHSSSLELPVNVLPLPDAMLAELLYNFDENSEEPSTPTQNVPITPPTMFREEGGVKKKSLALSTVGFRKHSLNSDKVYKRRSSIQMSSDLLEDGYKMLKKTTSYHDKYCRCCTEPCHSPRSSDSGMAGSCTLNSPEFPLQDRCSVDATELYKKFGDTNTRNVVSLMDSEAYESQCRCTSPFGSTPRTSANVVIESVRTSFSSADMPPIPPPWDSVNQIHSKIMDIRNESIIHSKSMSCIVQPKLFEANEGKSEIYRSGLYAHWWLKAKVPIEVVKGIYEETRNDKTDVSISSNTKQQSRRRDK